MRQTRPGSTALFGRELTRIARCAATAAGIGAHLAGVAAFTLLWSGGGVVPLLPGASLFEQQRHAQWVGLLAIVPWITARVVAAEPEEKIARLAARVGAQAREAVVARFAAAGVLAILVAGAPLPLVAVAQQVSAVPGWAVALSGLELAGVALAAAFVTLAWMRRPLPQVPRVPRFGDSEPWNRGTQGSDACGTRVARWLAATATTAVVVGAIRAVLHAMGAA